MAKRWVGIHLAKVPTVFGGLKSKEIGLPETSDGQLASPRGGQKTTSIEGGCMSSILNLSWRTIPGSLVTEVFVSAGTTEQFIRPLSVGVRYVAVIEGSDSIRLSSKARSYAN
jgi:hypothetical protein